MRPEFYATALLCYGGLIVWIPLYLLISVMGWVHLWANKPLSPILINQWKDCCFKTAMIQLVILISSSAFLFYLGGVIH